MDFGGRLCDRCTHEPATSPRLFRSRRALKDKNLLGRIILAIEPKAHAHCCVGCGVPGSLVSNQGGTHVANPSVPRLK